MLTTKMRVRRDYKPLNIAISIVNRNPLGSPMTQVYTEKMNSYEPNHINTPLVLGVNPIMKVKDGKKTTEYGNKDIGEMKWLLNGKDITTLSDWKACSSGMIDGDYVITKDGDNRGQIIIYKNFQAGWRGDLSFAGKIYDKRTGLNIELSTDPVSIGCDNSSEDKYKIDLEEDEAIIYNPFIDLRALNDYLEAHGITVSDKDKQKAESSKNTYLRTVPIHVYQGATELSKGYSVNVYRVDAAGTATNIDTTADDNEIVELTLKKVTIDLRLTESENYRVDAVMDGKTIGSDQFSVKRKHPVYRLTPLNRGSIPADATFKISEAECSSEGEAIDYPERVLDIHWKTDTANKTGVEHNVGDVARIDLDKTGIGDTNDDDWIDIYMESEQKGAYAIATDSDGAELLDENGKPYIFN